MQSVKVLTEFRVLTLNLKRIFTLTQLCTPLLERAARPEDPARIINIGSIDGIRVPLHPTFAYSASKAGLHHLSRHLATQLGPRFITSNTIACGAFESKMMHATLSKFGDKIRKSVPLGRIGEPSDVAGTVIYLASKAGAYTTGATIRVGMCEIYGNFLLTVKTGVPVSTRIYSLRRLPSHTAHRHWAIPLRRHPFAPCNGHSSASFIKI